MTRSSKLRATAVTAAILVAPMALPSCGDVGEKWAHPAYLRFRPMDGAVISPNDVIGVDFRSGKRPMGPPTLETIALNLGLFLDGAGAVRIVTTFSSTPSTGRIDITSPSPLPAGNHTLVLRQSLLADTSSYVTEPNELFYVDLVRETIGARFTVGLDGGVSN